MKRKEVCLNCQKEADKYKEMFENNPILHQTILETLFTNCFMKHRSGKPGSSL